MKPIEIQNLTKVYGKGETEVRALQGIDLKIGKGELLSLLGVSGSGKTTLISIIGCILSASSGSCKILGQETVGLSQSRLQKIRLKHIGFIFQSFNLFPALNAFENVELALNLKGIRGEKAKKQAGELLEKVRLTEKSKAHPGKLSGGQKQRVAIARALAGNPKIILADEPTAALDSSNGEMVLSLLQDLAHKNNCTVIVGTHDPLIFKYADRAVSLENGKVTLQQDKEQLAELNNF